MFHIANGVWPTMVTPFTPTYEVDYAALERLVEWYISKGVDGLFAVCQSSEMFHLSLDERVRIAQIVKQCAGRRIPVIASGHVSDSVVEQQTELQLLAQTGIDGLVLVTNRFAGPDDTEDVWRENLVTLLEGMNLDMPLGWYECPYPYKRLISPKCLKWCAEYKNFVFLKDTSCNIDHIKAKINAVDATSLKLFNANSATLLDSLKLGAAGYSGVMANIHPELYVWLVSNWRDQPQRAAKLMDFLSLASLLETQLYPACAKYYLMLEGVLDNIVCRTRSDAQFTATQRLQVEQLQRLTHCVSDDLGIARSGSC